MTTDSQPSTRRIPWSAIFTIGLAIVLLFLAFRGVDWQSLLETVRQGKIEVLAVSFWIISVAYFGRALRWRVLLSAEKTIHPVTVFWGTCVGYLGNLFLPARAGELIRSALLGEKTGINKGYVLATAFTERIMDAGFLVIISLVALSTMENIPEALQRTVVIMGGISFIGITLLFFTPRFEGLIQTLFQKLPLPSAFKLRIQPLIEQFLNGMRAFQNPGRALRFAALTLIIWGIDTVFALEVARAFGFTLTPAQTLLFLAALGLASAAPSTPGYLGIYQFVSVTVLPLFGFEQDEALVYIFAIQAVTYAIVLTWGLIGLWRLGYQRSS